MRLSGAGWNYSITLSKTKMTLRWKWRKNHLKMHFLLYKKWWFSIPMLVLRIGKNILISSCRSPKFWSLKTQGSNRRIPIYRWIWISGFVCGKLQWFQPRKLPRKVRKRQGRNSLPKAILIRNLNKKGKKRKTMFFFGGMGYIRIVFFCWSLGWVFLQLCHQSKD